MLKHERPIRAYTTKRKLRVPSKTIPLGDHYQRLKPGTIHDEVERPTCRSECIGQERPCPWVACKYHLYIDVNRYGGIQLNFPGLEVHQMRDTCALDVADRGGITLEEVGIHINVSRERIRQIERDAIEHLRVMMLDGYSEE